VHVEKTGEATRLVRPECDLFDDAHAAAVAHFRANEVLNVDLSEIEGVEVVESY
jgi:hypothetical protein